jgi:autotransporter translocation and assembly factor TamB
MSYTRRSLQVVAFLATLVVGTAAMAVIVTQTTWFKEWLRGFIVRQAGDYVNGQLSIGKLDGNLFFGVNLGDVDVTVNGEKVVDVSDVSLDYNAFTLVRGDVVLDEIRLTRPVLRLERDARGWNLAHLIRARTPDPDEPKNRRTLEIGELTITDGTLYLDKGAVGTSGMDVPSRIEKFDAAVAIRSNEDELTVDIDRASLRAAEPNVGINAMSGVIRRTRNQLTFDNVAIRTEESSLRVNGTVRNIEGSSPVVNLKASSDKLALNEMAKLLPRLRGYALQPAFDVAARGPADRMDVDLSFRDPRLGTVTADLTLDTTAPMRRATGSAHADHLNVQALVRDGAGRPGLASDITGDTRFDLTLPEGSRPVRGSYSVDIDRVRIAGYDARRVVGTGRIDGTTIRVDARGDAYGGHATAAGTVRAGAPLALDLRGRASGVNLRNLPAIAKVPAATSNLQFNYTLSARGLAFRGTATFDQSTVAGATIAPGATGTFAFGDGVPTYTAKGEVTGLDVQRAGQEFSIPAIATDRYRSVINGPFDVSGSGGGRYPLTLDVTGTLVESQIFGASFPRMDVTTNLMAGNARVKTVGTFSGLDPAVITGDARIAGTLTGSVDADTTIRAYAGGVTVDSVDTAGRVELARSTVGKLTIDSAVIDGNYSNREGQLTRLQVTGSDLNVTASGAIALNETGASNLALHADTPSLDRIGELVGQPLKGAVVVDGTVTGNARALKADGTLTGSNIGQGDNEALSLTSTFSATVPDLQLAQARVQANSSATFLEIGGQKINELTAETTYAQSQLDFKGNAREGRRELTAAGSVLLHPDHQEIHINDLALRAEQVEWRTPAGAAAAVRYGKDRVEVKNLQLTNGEQHITADGVVAGLDSVLKVHAENVDVAQLDTLLLGDGRLAGRFTGDAEISGSLREPTVSSNFTLAQGAFRTFKFEALTGTVDYTQTGVAMDVRLQQTPAAWITAKGIAPLTLFQPTPPGLDPHDESRIGGVVDIQVASSQIDLGVVQGLTPYVTNVAGTLQANVHVTGSGYDPHADGAIEVRGGAFAIPELGTSYSGLDTRIELKPDVVTVQQFKILDSRGFPMTVGGTLAVHERAVGAVNITLQSDDFEVIDNRIADLKLDAQLKITGEIRKPRLEGTVDVENGTVHLAELLEATTATPYAVEATDLAIAGADEAARSVPPDAPKKPEQPTLFSALELDVNLNVPDNLVLRGNSLRPANAPIDIGDVNVTVGGEVRVQKAAGASVRLLGDVDTVRGNYTFQGRRFEILRDGHLRFDGDDELNPTLNIRARRIISGVETFVRVQGTMQQPELSFSSNPPLDQADILSLIVFNTPINELGEGQQVSLTERATALAGGYLATGLSRSISNALELDEFEIQAGERGFGPTLSVGEQVGEHFFFRVRQGFGDAQATELILEYQLEDHLRVQGTAAETSGAQRVTFRRVERAGLDLIFFFSY